MSKSTHDLIAANRARVQDILRVVGAGNDIADASNEPHTKDVLDPLDDGSIVGTWSLWDS